MKRRSLLSILTLAISFGAAAAAHGQGSARSVAPTPDGNGNYTWRWTDAAGTAREWVFVPENKISPVFVVVVSQAGGEGYVYSYTLNNAASAKQGINYCIVELAMPTVVRATPPGWSVFAPTNAVPNVAWVVDRLGTGELGGLLPGSSVSGFELSSQVLPGVTPFRCTSNAEPTSWPDDLPAAIVKQAEQLPATLDVRGQTIAPILSVSDTSYETLARRVIRNYRLAVRSSQLTDRAQLVSDLDRIATIKGPDAHALLRGLVARLSYAGSDPWSKQLADALKICLTHLSARVGQQG